jgi:hypothetical protein
MSRRNPQPYLEAKVTFLGGDSQYADYWPGRTPGEIVKELGVTLREVELISAEKGKGWVRIYPRAKARKNAYRHSDLQHVHDYDFPVGRKNARGAIPAISRGERHGYAPEGSLRRKERSIDEISEVVANMKKSPGALRPFEQRKKARKKGRTRIVRPKGNPVEYLTPSEYIKGLDAGLFKVDDPRIKVLSKKKPRHATPKEAFADGFSAARSAWHSGQHGFSDIGYWILKNATDGSLFEERSTFGDEYRRGAKEYWLARRDAESRRTGWESSDWLERGLNNPSVKVGDKIRTSRGEEGEVTEIRDTWGYVAGNLEGWFPLSSLSQMRVLNNPRRILSDGTVIWGRGSSGLDSPRRPEGQKTYEVTFAMGWAGGKPRYQTVTVKAHSEAEADKKARQKLAPGARGIPDIRAVDNPDWKALGEKTKRGAQKGWKATKHAGKVAAWQAEGAVLKTELADLRRCAKNLSYDDYKSGPAYQAAQERVSTWKKRRPVKQNPVWVSPEGTAGYLSGESHTRYKKKHPKRGLVPKFMERQVRLETPLQDPPSGYRILEFEVTERGRPVTHFRIYEGMRDTGKYARDWNKAVQIAHKLAKRGREALKAAANNPRVRTGVREPKTLTRTQCDRKISAALKEFYDEEWKRSRKNPRGRRDMTMLIGEDGAEWAKWSQNREGIIHRNPQVLYFPGKGMGGSGPRGGYSPAERAALPRGAFLKPGKRSWPVSDKEHAKIALQYMTRGYGNKSEYPLLLQRLAGFWPVDQNPDIWAKYRDYKRGIEEKCGCHLPTVEELRDVGPSPRDWPPVRRNKGTQRRRRRTTHWYK